MVDKDNIFKSGILGCFIGLAIIIPGFSGAQLAIIFKMYDRIVEALGKLFTKKSILFLLPILIGALIGFALGLVTVRFLLELSIFAVIALFAGMMLGGMPSIFDEIRGTKFNKKYIVNILIGLAIPISISAIAINTNLNLSNLLTDIPWYMYVICLGIGVLIALTQLIPGLSATALLMSFGLYNALLDSIHFDVFKSNPMIILVFLSIIIGGLLGVIFISKLIDKALNKYKTGFYYVIIGLCFSSIACMFYNPEIMEFYTNWNDNSMLHIGIGIVLFAVGTAVVYLGYRYTEKKKLEKASLE